MVAYDVATDTKEGRARLRKVALVCQDYGQRVQKSVFECDVSQAQYERMKRRLLRCMNNDEDNLKIYRLQGSRESVVEEFGIGSVIDFRGPLVV